MGLTHPAPASAWKARGPRSRHARYTLEKTFSVVYLAWGVLGVVARHEVGVGCVSPLIEEETNMRSKKPKAEQYRVENRKNVENV